MINFDPIAIAHGLTAAAEAVRQTANAPAVVVQVDRGALVASTAAGISNLVTNTDAAAQQTFEIGSQTKLMTAVAILQLVEAGKIDLDRHAADYLPTATLQGIANTDTVTVRQLLNMTAGIDNYTEVRDADDVPLFVKALLEHPDQIFGPQQALDLARGLPALSAPGTEYFYSNTNYTILGQIVEAQTGKPFFDALNAGIFTKADMAHTVRQLGTDDPRLSSYLENPATGELIDVTRAPWEMRGEAGIASTSADMVKFLQALFVDKTLLNAASLAEMTEFVPTGANDVIDTGFGLGLVKFAFIGGDTYYGFTGGTLGTASSTYLNLNTGAVVAIGATGSEVDTLAGGFSVLQATLADPTWNIVDDGSALQIVSGAAHDLTLTQTAEGMTFEIDGAALTLDRSLKGVTSQNVKFNDGSVLIVGNNSTNSAGDDRANRIDILRDFKSAAGADNQILGLGGNDNLKGGNGDDRIVGGTGHDVLIGRIGADDLYGETGHDRLYGGAGADQLSGGAERDQLFGGDGADILSGGAGADGLWGGAGADRFVFDTTAGTARDKIQDFARGTDIIDLADLSDGPLTWIAGAGFDGIAGQMRSVSGKGGVIVSGDLDGDGKADFQLFVENVTSLSAEDFLFT